MFISDANAKRAIVKWSGAAVFGEYGTANNKG